MTLAGIGRAEARHGHTDAATAIPVIHSGTGS
jgi:hypothetical protein